VALPFPLLNENSSELSLLLFATATFGELLKFVPFCRSMVYFTASCLFKSHLEMFFRLSILLGAPFLNNHDMKIIVIEQL